MQSVDFEKMTQLTIYECEEPIETPTFAQVSSSFIFEFGADGTQLQYLLGVIIGGRNKKTAHALTELGINTLMKMSENDFLSYRGIGHITAARLSAVFSIARRTYPRSVKN